MTLPVEPVRLPACLVGQSNGELDLTLLWPTPGQVGGPTVRLVEPAARAWRALAAAALAAGHTLKATSSADSYRTLAQQTATFISRYQLDDTPWGYRWWDSDGNGVRERWWRKTQNTAPAAVPGTSNHGLGLAVDTGEERDGDTGTESMDQATLDWLVAHELAFGFSHELQVEPWHIRYWAGDTIPAAVLAYEASQRGADDMGVFVLRDFPSQPLGTQGAYHIADASDEGYHLAPRESFNAVAWPGAPQLSPANVPAKYDYPAMLRILFGAPRQDGGTAPSGPVDLSEDALAEVRTIVDEELDEQSRGGADVGG